MANALYQKMAKVLALEKAMKAYGSPGNVRANGHYWRSVAHLLLDDPHGRVLPPTPNAFRASLVASPYQIGRRQVKVALRSLNVGYRLQAALPRRSGNRCNLSEIRAADPAIAVWH
jgi:hypothetical protein